MKKAIGLLVLTMVAAACGSGGSAERVAGKETAVPEVEAKAPVSLPAEANADLAALYERAKNDVTRLGIAIEAYRMDIGHFPQVRTIRELATLPGFVPDFIKAVPLEDPWGNDFLYEYSDFGFSVGCGGSDGVFAGFQQAGEIDLEPGVDVIFKNNNLSLNPQEKVNWN
jgi:hypothetical protein